MEVVLFSRGYNHGSHQCKISSEKMVHLAFHHLLYNIINAIFACLGYVGMLD